LETAIQDDSGLPRDRAEVANRRDDLVAAAQISAVVVPAADIETYNLTGNTNREGRAVPGFLEGAELDVSVDCQYQAAVHLFGKPILQ
jgi:hypothetical protein